MTSFSILSYIQMGDATEWAMEFAAEAASFATESFLFLFDFAESSLDGFVFTGALYFFLESEVLVDILKLLPVSNAQREDIDKLLKASIFQVFYSSGALCLINGVSTWIYFTLFNIVPPLCCCP